MICSDSKVIELDDLKSIELLPSTKDSRNLIQSKFKGVNYVFDERIASRITEDVLTSCEMCGEQCDAYGNCQNAPCNVSRLTLIREILYFVHSLT